jgi:hypothetical protein
VTSETALAALFRAISARAIEPGAPWGSRAYLSLAPMGTPYPYLVFQMQAGGEVNGLRARDGEFVMVIKAFDDSVAGALGCAAVIADRFNDAGLYDRPGDPLDGGAGWAILTSTQERAIFLPEQVDGELVYQAGAQFRIRMQAA